MSRESGGRGGFRRDQDGRLFAEGVSLQAVADAAGTPCYVYSQKAVEDAARAWLRAFPAPHRVCYAVKANDQPAILRLLADAGLGFDVVSGGELARVRDLAPDAPVVFSGVGKTDAELSQALDADLASLNLESLDELRALDRLAAGARQRIPVMLRVRVGIAAGGHRHLVTAAEDSKFGIAPSEVAEALRLCAESLYIQAVGLAAHLGSQLESPAPYASSLQALTDLLDAAGEDGRGLQCLDLGGGLGVGPDGWRFAPAELAAALEEPLRRAEERLGRALRLTFEPGRSLLAQAGALLTRVVRTKRLGGCQLCLVCDAGMNDYARAALYGAAPQVDAVGPPPAQVQGVLAGPVCESGDVFARGPVPACASGDLLALRDAGAYGMAMASNYNLRPLPAEVLASGSQALLVRRRQTRRDMDACLTQAPLIG